VREVVEIARDRNEMDDVRLMRSRLIPPRDELCTSDREFPHSEAAKSGKAEKNIVRKIHFHIDL